MNYFHQKKKHLKKMKKNYCRNWLKKVLSHIPHLKIIRISWITWACKSIEILRETNIGSRPAKRGASSRIKLKDLRAIPFVGAWSQLKQNVTGYYGVGTAFKKWIRQARFQN